MVVLLIASDLADFSKVTFMYYVEHEIYFKIKNRGDDIGMPILCSILSIFT